MSVSERVRNVVEPVVAAQGVELFDLEQAGPVLRITIDKPGGVDVDDLARVTRAVSHALDEHDPIESQYTLEVSSPGLERVLRTPRHYEWAVGKQVAVKTLPGHAAGRRFTGTLVEAGAVGVTLVLDEPVGERVTLAHRDIEKARSVFVWGPAPKPGTGSKPGPARSQSPKGAKSKAAGPDVAPAPGPPSQPPSGTEVPSS